MSISLSRWSPPCSPCLRCRLTPIRRCFFLSPSLSSLRLYSYFRGLLKSIIFDILILMARRDGIFFSHFAAFPSAHASPSARCRTIRHSPRYFDRHISAALLDTYFASKAAAASNFGFRLFQPLAIIIIIAVFIYSCYNTSAMAAYAFLRYYALPLLQNTL